QAAIGARQRIAPFRRAQFAIAGRLAKSHAEHDAIVSAVLRGDAETASELMRTHVNIVRAASWNYVHGLELAAPDPRTDPDVDSAAARAAADPDLTQSPAISRALHSGYARWNLSRSRRIVAPVSMEALPCLSQGQFPRAGPSFVRTAEHFIR